MVSLKPLAVRISGNAVYSDSNPCIPVNSDHAAILYAVIVCRAPGYPYRINDNTLLATFLRSNLLYLLTHEYDYCKYRPDYST